MIPRVSVIVPNYNHARFLEKRISSILDQTYRNFETVILDDGSTDGSRDIISSFRERHPGIITVYNGKNSGSPFSQWNQGVNRSLGEYLWIAESDDFATLDFLEHMVPVLDSNPDVGFAYCNGWFVDEVNNRISEISDIYKSYDPRRKRNYVSDGRNEIENYLYRFNTVNNVSGVLFRKSSYLRSGSAIGGMKYCGDWFLYILILLESGVAYVARPMNYVRIHPGSGKNSYFKGNSYLGELISVYQMLLEKLGPATCLKEALAYYFFLSLIRGRIPSAENLRKAQKMIPGFTGFAARSLFRFGFRKIAGKGVVSGPSGLHMQQTRNSIEMNSNS